MKQDRNGVSSDHGAERARWVQQYRASGLGLRQFAERHGLRVGQLHYWVYQSRERRVTKAPRPVFQEVRWPAAVATPVSWSAEVGLPNGTTVRVVQGTDVTWALALVECLCRPCSS